ncbi:MAG TPA: Fic family protein [Desulfobacteraceae bacterium]|nr:Fic family protein [Desulfobacteraceae bacterium]HPJ68436.1 Fic family protein [Desulfobacteraceae bacterium]HPQ29950.1 Fic family protein [Desulfobacteraceae bacterium]
MILRRIRGIFTVKRAENMMYIHELDDWPDFRWDRGKLAERLAAVRHQQGRLIGRMEALGFDLREEAVLHTLTEEVLKSSEIEGKTLERSQVRSSIARRLGMDIGALTPADRNVEGVVEMMLDAVEKYSETLTSKRLFAWHAALFPTGHSGMKKITVGAWRTDQSGPMQVVSGPVGREGIHYQAPAAERLEEEMASFLSWVNRQDDSDPVLKAAIAHLWFVTIHPFDDGNGRIARAIADMLLARSEQSPQRFYSMSARMRKERNSYYDILQATQTKDLDITNWLEWFLECLAQAINGAENTLVAVLRKARFWEVHRGEQFNERQRAIIMRLLDKFEGKLTSSRWAKLTKCSQDTALRDIDNLLSRNILIKEPGGGRSTSYALADIE